MAHRRMFSADIVASDAFLDMSTSTRELYFQLGMYADDDGFVNPKKIMRMVGASSDDLKVLVSKRFLIPFESGVVVIKHWLIHNLIRSDRYKETMYLEEKKTLSVKENKAYTELATIGIPNDNQMETQVRLGKVSIVKDNTKNTYGEFSNVLLKEDEYLKLTDSLGEKNTSILIEELSTYMASRGKKYSSHYATLLNWARRRVQDHVKDNKPKRTLV